MGKLLKFEPRKIETQPTAYTEAETNAIEAVQSIRELFTPEQLLEIQTELELEDTLES